MENGSTSNFTLEMAEIKNLLINFWENEFKPVFKEGLITLESQLQAELYFYLRKNLMVDSNGNKTDYHIWSKPRIYRVKTKLLNKEPDLVITKGGYILAIIELKFSPWAKMNKIDDISKLELFDINFINEKLEFGSGHFYSNKYDDGIKIEACLYEEHLKCFIVFAKAGSKALKLNTNELCQNFLLLKGHIENNGSCQIFGD
ncbi:MAG: hypothetical protein NT007_00300 [Candidatus Kapabacteria bacterium]|nr:hypothetical protein [Candidatus Kapabacteria bacterium]